MEIVIYLKTVRYHAIRHPGQTLEGLAYTVVKKFNHNFAWAVRGRQMKNQTNVVKSKSNENIKEILVETSTLNSEIE